jgi:hypothetical protein
MEDSQFSEFSTSSIWWSDGLQRERQITDLAD